MISRDFLNSARSFNYLFLAGSGQQTGRGRRDKIRYWPIRKRLEQARREASGVHTGLAKKFLLSPTHVYSETVTQCRYISGQVFSWESEVQARSIIQRDQGTARFKITVKSCCVIVRKKPTVPASYSTGRCWSCSRSHGLLQNWFYLQTCSMLSCNKYKQVVAGST